MWVPVSALLMLQHLSSAMSPQHLCLQGVWEYTLSLNYPVTCGIQGSNKVEFYLNDLPPQVASMLNLPKGQLCVTLIFAQSDSMAALKWKDGPPAHHVNPPTVSAIRKHLLPCL